MPYALVISSGNDGTGCIRQLERILTGLKAKKIQENLIIHGIPDADHIEACKALGQAISAGLAMGVF